MGSRGSTGVCGVRTRIDCLALFRIGLFFALLRYSCGWPAKRAATMLLSSPDVTSDALLFEFLLRLKPVIQFPSRRPAPRHEDFLSALPNFLKHRGSALGGSCWIVLSCRVALSYSCFHNCVCFRARFSRGLNPGKRIIGRPAAEDRLGSGREHRACARCALPENRLSGAAAALSGWVD